MNKEEFIEQYAVDRRGTNCLRWDALEERYGQADLLSLWVADMDFKVADEITQAIQGMVDLGIYGYNQTGPDYYKAFSDWMEDRFGLAVPSEQIRFTSGVVQAIHLLIHAFSQVDDSIIILTPVYYPFHDAVRNTGRRLITVDLIYDEETGRFEIDFDRFEQAIIDAQVKLFIHCSPHNPAGRVWTMEEQDRLFEICDQHDVFIISDEIHQDIVFEGRQQIPAAKVAGGRYNHRLAMATSTSKSFNLAGLSHSHIIIPDADLRQRFDETALLFPQGTPNNFSLVATQAAYAQAGAWLDQVLEVIWDNYVYLKDRLATELSEVVVTPLEGTYLMLVNLNPLLKGRDTKEFIQDKAGLAINYGESFGAGYEGFIRINLASHPNLIKEAASRIIDQGQSYRQ